jgi:diacylglycerol kinase family enzyme
MELVTEGEPMNYLIIHNPLSFNRRSKWTTARIVRFFKKNGIPFILRSTFKIDDLMAFLKANPSITDIVYCGGDGTINYMINHVDVGVIQPRIHFAQSGSGNDFLRSLKPLGKGDIRIGNAVTDVGTVKFVNGCGIGIDGFICHFVNADKHKNKLSYMINAFRGFTRFHPVRMTVTVDGVATEFPRAYFAAVQNGRYFGGGMKVAPAADPRSDTFQIVVAHSISRFLLSFLFMTIYSGLHLRFRRYVTLLVGKKIDIKVDRPQYFQNDGEVLENVSSVRVTKSFQREFIAFNKPAIAAANRSE